MSIYTFISANNWYQSMKAIFSHCRLSDDSLKTTDGQCQGPINQKKTR